MNIQDWFPLGLTGLISLLSKGLPRVFSSTIVLLHSDEQWYYKVTLASLWPLHSPQRKNHLTPWKASLSRLPSHRFSWSPSSFTGSSSWVSTLGLTSSTHSQNSPPIQFCSGLMSLFALAWYQDFEKLPPANGFQMFHLHRTHLPQAQIHMSDHILDVSLGCPTASSNSIWPKPSSWLPSHQTSSSAVFNHFSFLTPHILPISKLCCLCLQSISKLTYFYLCYSHPGLRLGPWHQAYRNCFLPGLFDSIIAFHGPLKYCLLILLSSTNIGVGSWQLSSVAQLCLTLCDPMDCSTPGFPVHHQLPELTQSKSHPSSWWCHPTISSSIVPFSSCPQSFPASGSFPVSQFFPWLNLSCVST